MKRASILILSVLAVLISGCGSDDSVSGPSAEIPGSVCYMRSIGYFDVTRGTYTSSYDDFVSRTCIRYKDSTETECDMLDTLMRVYVEECVDLGDMEPSCSIYYFRAGAPNGPSGLYIDYSGTGDMEQIITNYQKENMDKVFDHISKVCY